MMLNLMPLAAKASKNTRLFGVVVACFAALGLSSCEKGVLSLQPKCPPSDPLTQVLIDPQLGVVESVVANAEVCSVTPAPPVDGEAKSCAAFLVKGVATGTCQLTFTLVGGEVHKRELQFAPDACDAFWGSANQIYLRKPSVTAGRAAKRGAL